MNTHSFTLAGQSLVARPSGALFWPRESLLCVSDLHLGKSVRQARRNGVQLPPYDLQDTLARLEAEINETGALCVICLGDSFDDLTALDELLINTVKLNELMVWRKIQEKTTLTFGLRHHYYHLPKWWK